MWHADGAMGWWMLFGGIWVFAVFGSLAWLAARVTYGRSTRADEPLETVRRRYAAGEINRDQFDQMNQDLGGSRAGHDRPWLFPVLVGVIFTALVAFLALGATGAIGGGDNWDFMDRMMRGGMMGMMDYGRSTADAPQTAGGQAETVSMRDFAFTPGNLQVPVGATVTWTNNDEAPHTATASDRSWDTGIVNKGQKKSLTFDKAGDYTYFCSVHPSMRARLVVR